MPLLQNTWSSRALFSRWGKRKAVFLVRMARREYRGTVLAELIRQPFGLTASRARLFPVVVVK